jgi:Asp-tRNA(Asn)/Glu-tRNA(Gln) amidotransferase A subunit family amidase
VVEAARALAARTLSSRELVAACLARIRERDGTPSFDGDPVSVNAWARVYRPSIRGFLEHGERRAMTREEYVAAIARRAEETAAWSDWLAAHRIDAILEPTVPIVARPRGRGYDEPFTDRAEISLTHYWDWVGFPVVALPSGIGSRSGLPVGVSLIGAPGANWDLLAWAARLEATLGTVTP